MASAALAQLLWRRRRQAGMLVAAAVATAVLLLGLLRAGTLPAPGRSIAGRGLAAGSRGVMADDPLGRTPSQRAQIDAWHRARSAPLPSPVRLRAYVDTNANTDKFSC